MGQDEQHEQYLQYPKQKQKQKQKQNNNNNNKNKKWLLKLLNKLYTNYENALQQLIEPCLHHRWKVIQLSNNSPKITTTATATATTTNSPSSSVPYLCFNRDHRDYYSEMLRRKIRIVNQLHISLEDLLMDVHDDDSLGKSLGRKTTANNNHKLPFEVRIQLLSFERHNCNNNIIDTTTTTTTTNDDNNNDNKNETSLPSKEYNKQPNEHQIEQQLQLHQQPKPQQQQQQQQQQPQHHHHRHQKNPK